MTAEFTMPDHAPKESVGSTKPGISEPSYKATVVPDELVNLNLPRDLATPNLTIVIPTRNERKNIESLLARLAPAAAPLNAEFVFVDDSTDDTPDVLVEQARLCPVPVRLLHRSPANRKGLSSAVIAGAKHARGEWVLVMDADLQHPPEMAVVLASTAMRYDSDIVVGTRYAGGRSAADGLGSTKRVLVSSYATRLAKNLFPRRLAMVSDPLSGLFAFRRSSINLDRLRPVGFKLLLEILVRNPVARVSEVAYRFEPRAAGDSKASFAQGLTYLRHLARLRGARLARQLRDRPSSREERVRQTTRFITFGLVGFSGIFVNSAALWFFFHTAGWNHLVAAALATQFSTAWNFALVDLVVYRNRAGGTRLGRALRFFIMNNVLLLARLPVLQLLVDRGLHILVANAITLVLLFVVRFALADRAIFAQASQAARPDPVRVLVDLSAAPANPPSPKRSRYLTYRYDVAGVVKIGSQIRLPELEFFRAQSVADSEMDIIIRVGDIGNRRPRRRAAMTESPDSKVISYEEHLGRLGANFRADISDQIVVEVGPLLARSRHVVYTNVIEPLLRFVMVSRGRMLLHSACIEIDGTGVMLSALTDTGKTGTILRLLRERGGSFLSDDMTVIDSDGNAARFPKPLTISAHTLRAVSADDLTPSEWRRLQIQSRLHSKGGRSIAMALSRFNLPIMGINALTQILIPPPKYTVDRLVPCQITSATRVSELFIIERGSPRMVDIEKNDAMDQLLENTEDAYGFPPYRYLAPAINIGAKDYRQLRAAERNILSGFLGNVRVRALASDSFSWADEIPLLIGQAEDPSREFAGNGAPAESSSNGAAAPPGFDTGQLNSHGLDEQAKEPLGLGGGLGKANGVGAAPGRGDHRPVSGIGVGPGSGLTMTDFSSGAAAVGAPVKPETVRRRRSVLRRLLYPGLPVLAVLALAVVFRFWHLTAVGFNTDEAVYTGSAASIARNTTLAPMFPVFRAHPELFQTLLSLVLRVRDTDWAARAFAAAIGVATVGGTYVLGRKLYGTTAGLLAGVLLAVMPYHVVVSRQVLLDGLMTLGATLALYCAVRYVETSRLSWLLACASAMSASILSKETSVVLLGGLYVFFALTPTARVRIWHLALGIALTLAEVTIWPIMIRLGGHSRTGQNYLLWQLFRRPNHGTWFYFTLLPGWIGLAVLVAALAGLIWLRRESSWRERLLLTWIAVPVLFFTLWPVKGFQYLLPISPALVILAARTLSRPLPFRRVVVGRLAMGALAAATAVSLAIPAWARSQPSFSTNFLAGSGGMVGGREAGKWVLNHVPAGSRLLAIGPSTANVLEYYGHRPVSALSVSSNPRDRNPTYAPVLNPDLAVRDGVFQYIVWDAYTDAHSSFFAAQALHLAKKYHGTAVYTSASRVRDPGRHGAPEPVVVIYEVYP
jgi:4-amino-4-deoxy-L-arabinose transferase-like glycosyltransferase/glycosyltransferase involved in cell wall biosynthesis